MGKTIPRRVNAHARRTSKSLEGKGEIESGEAFEEIRETTLTARFVAWGIIIGSILFVIWAGRCIVTYDGGDSEEGLTPRTISIPAPTATVEGLTGRSPFPDAPTRSPIITEVECPVDTVQIVTGDRATDTVCIRGTVQELPYSETSSVGPLTWGRVCDVAECSPPIFRPCLEDEITDTITGECIHVDRIAPLGTATPTPTREEGGNTDQTAGTR